METKTNILIVDDEPINLDFFDVMLSKLGFIVMKAEDGEEALEKIKTRKPDLIVLDNIMPKLSGWQVTRILKQDKTYAEYKDIPIIMFSAMDDVKDKIEGFELGVEDYITKPFNFSEVLARIRAVLRNRRLSKQIIQKEKRIAISESLNNSLLYFTEHLKQPVLGLKESAKELQYDDMEAVKAFTQKIISETSKVLLALESIEEEVEELKSKDELVKQGEEVLEDLEYKFQNHLERLKEVT